MRGCGYERVKKDHRAAFMHRVLVHAPSFYGDAPVAHFLGHVERVERGVRVWTCAGESEGYSGRERNQTSCTDGAGAVLVRNSTRKHHAYLKFI